MQQVHLLISGDVQGVGFRQFVRSKARKLGLVGWTRNLSDGRVEVCAQGEKDRLEELVGRCKNGPTFSESKYIAVWWEDSMEHFEDFRVYPTQ